MCAKKLMQIKLDSSINATLMYNKTFSVSAFIISQYNSSVHSGHSHPFKN